MGIAVLLAGALLSHWWRLSLRHGATPHAVVEWYRGAEAAMLFPKAGVEVAEDMWMNLFHHTIAFLVLGGLLVRTGARPAVKGTMAAAFGAAALVSAAGPALVWWGVPLAASAYVGALVALSALGLVVLWLVVRDAVLRRGAGHRGAPGSHVFALLVTLIGLAVWPSARASAQQLLTERQAIAKVFPGGRFVATDTIRPDSAARVALQGALGRPLYEPAYAVRRVYGEGGILLGYTLVTDERGKYRPITMLIGVDTTHRVAGVQIVVYREPRGGEVSRQYFLRQYRGKRVGDPVRLNRDIINISGATISVHSVNAGVRKTLALLDRYYRRSARSPVPPVDTLLLLESLP